MGWGHWLWIALMLLHICKSPVLSSEFQLLVRGNTESQAVWVLISLSLSTHTSIPLLFSLSPPPLQLICIPQCSSFLFHVIVSLIPHWFLHSPIFSIFWPPLLIFHFALSSLKLSFSSVFYPPFYPLFSLPCCHPTFSILLSFSFPIKHSLTYFKTDVSTLIKIKV